MLVSVWGFGKQISDLCATTCRVLPTTVTIRRLRTRLVPPAVKRKGNGAGHDQTAAASGGRLT